MREHYSKFGPAPRPASYMLRSLILSILQGTSSITKWVDLMRSNSLYAIISVFSPDDVPGVGTPVVTSARFRNRNLLESEFNDSCKDGERYFSQPDCDVGWDSSRYCYYVGSDLYLLTDIKKDLPIFLHWVLVQDTIP